MARIKTYSETIRYSSFEERLQYLMLKDGHNLTFGDQRHLNQIFYHTPEWKAFRREIIIRDNGCDLAFPEYVVDNYSRLIIHHLNPLKPEDILNRTSKLMDPENVICVSFNTHQLIHYGDDFRATSFVGRSAGDTCPWR